MDYVWVFTVGLSHVVAACALIYHAHAKRHFHDNIIQHAAATSNPAVTCNRIASNRCLPALSSSCSKLSGNDSVSRANCNARPGHVLEDFDCLEEDLASTRTGSSIDYGAQRAVMVSKALANPAGPGASLQDANNSMWVVTTASRSPEGHDTLPMAESSSTMAGVSIQAQVGGGNGSLWKARLPSLADAPDLCRITELAPQDDLAPAQVSSFNVFLQSSVTTHTSCMQCGRSCNADTHPSAVPFTTTKIVSAVPMRAEHKPSNCLNSRVCCKAGVPESSVYQSSVSADPLQNRSEQISRSLAEQNNTECLQSRSEQISRSLAEQVRTDPLQSRSEQFSRPLAEQIRADPLPSEPLPSLEPLQLPESIQDHIELATFKLSVQQSHKSPVPQTSGSYGCDHEAVLLTNADATHKCVGIRWSGICCTVSHKGGEEVILQSVWGTVRSGELQLLLGPSGAGKSTLLAILSGRDELLPRNPSLQGTITVGNEAVKGHELGDLVTYITQDDNHVSPNLTAAETLRFHALLAFGFHQRHNAQEVVDKNLATVGLLSQRDVLVGGLMHGGGSIRGLSGGERKRLVLALGLMQATPILLVDEPTSGLDSSSALHMMEILHNMATTGLTILTALHQPRPAIWNMFHAVMVMAKGHMIYSGMCGDMVGWFLQHVLDATYCPLRHGVPSDWVLDTIGDADAQQLQELCATASAEWLGVLQQQGALQQHGMSQQQDILQQQDTLQQQDNSQQQDVLQQQDILQQQDNSQQQDVLQQQDISQQQDILQQQDALQQGILQQQGQGSSSDIATGSADEQPRNAPCLVTANTEGADSPMWHCPHRIARGDIDLQRLSDCTSGTANTQPLNGPSHKIARGEAVSGYAGVNEALENWTEPNKNQPQHSGPRLVAAWFEVLWQAWVLLQKEALSMRRTPLQVMAKTMVFVWSGLMLGLVYYRLDDTFLGNTNKYNLLFTQLSVLVTLPYMYSLTYAMNKQQFISDVRAGLFHPFAFYLAKLAITVPLHVVNCTLYTTTVYSMAGLRKGPGVMLQHGLFAALLMVIACQVLHLSVTLCTNHDGAFMLTTMWSALNMLMSGFFMEPQRAAIPQVFTLQYLSAFKYTLNALALLEFGNTGNTTRPRSGNCNRNDLLTHAVTSSLSPQNTTPWDPQAAAAMQHAAVIPRRPDVTHLAQQLPPVGSSTAPGIVASMGTAVQQGVANLASLGADFLATGQLPTRLSDIGFMRGHIAAKSGDVASKAEGLPLAAAAATEAALDSANVALPLPGAGLAMLDATQELFGLDLLRRSLPNTANTTNITTATNITNIIKHMDTTGWLGAAAVLEANGTRVSDTGFLRLLANRTVANISISSSSASPNGGLLHGELRFGPGQNKTTSVGYSDIGMADCGRVLGQASQSRFDNHLVGISTCLPILMTQYVVLHILTYIALLWLRRRCNR